MFDIKTTDVPKEILNEYFGIFAKGNLLITIADILLGIGLIYVIFKLLISKPRNIASLFVIPIVLFFGGVISLWFYICYSVVETNKYDYKSTDFIAKGTITNITNGSDKDNQELRISADGHNYYVTIDKDVVTNTGDAVKVEGKNVYTSKNDRESHDLSKNLETKPVIVSITHDNATNTIQSIPKDSEGSL